ncbi:MAG: cation transporter [Fibrobacter sp.]|uniref:cation diffusion facilitator family transporter n=1 Tax=Fibrobacter TaxID=832 RepID=UPI001568A2B0|nr:MULTISPECIES: cation diffusion facilitator family transporter [Fibrobacter]MBQ7079341.1 cation transporter [Fibrobacter sp.]
MTRVRKKDDSAEVRKVTWVGLGWNAALSVAKLVVGVVGNSQALVADAIHSASDFATDVAVIVGSHFWNSPPDAEHPYGHRRFETLVTIGIGLAVAAVGVGIGYKSVLALLAGEVSHPEMSVAIMALASILVKEGLFRYTRNAGRKIRSQALEANAWHHRSDSFSSIPVLVAVIFAILLPEMWFADSVGALIVAFFIMHSAIEIAAPGLHQLVDRGANPEILENLRNLALSHPKVISLHGLRSRYVGSDLHVDVHIVVDDQMTLKDAHDVAEEVEQRLIDSDENVVDALVHIDPYNAKRYTQDEIKTIDK